MMTPMMTPNQGPLHRSGTMRPPIQTPMMPTPQYPVTPRPQWTATPQRSPRPQWTPQQGRSPSRSQFAGPYTATPQQGPAQRTPRATPGSAGNPQDWARAAQVWAKNKGEDASRQRSMPKQPGGGDTTPLIDER